MRLGLKMPVRMRRFAILGAAAALSAGTLATGLTTQAQAQSGFTMHLTNDSAWGTFAGDGVIGHSPIAVKQEPWGSWGEIPEGNGTVGGVSGAEIEFPAITASHNVSNLCMAATADAAEAYLATCGANGTVWLAVQSGNGTLLYSRFLLSRGFQDVIAVHSPSTDAGVIAIPESAVGGSWFGRWTVH
jgi:hypothetical protein